MPSKDEMRVILDNHQANIKSNAESLETLRVQREQIAGDIARLERGDDLRQVILAGAQKRLAIVDQLITQQEHQLKLQQESARHLRNAFEG